MPVSYPWAEDKYSLNESKNGEWLKEVLPNVLCVMPDGQQIGSQGDSKVSSMIFKKYDTSQAKHWLCLKSIWSWKCFPFSSSFISLHPIFFLISEGSDLTQE